jgi:maltose alpha-D-glucosyltransferase/alpha-amylase
LKSYLKAIGDSGLVPREQTPLRVLLEAHLFEKALTEIDYELSHRIDWIRIPLHGLLQLLEPSKVL